MSHRSADIGTDQPTVWCSMNELGRIFRFPRTTLRRWVLDDWIPLERVSARSYQLGPDDVCALAIALAAAKASQAPAIRGSQLRAIFEDTRSALRRADEIEGGAALLIVSEKPRCLKTFVSRPCGGFPAEELEAISEAKIWNLTALRDGIAVGLRRAGKQSLGQLVEHAIFN